MDTQSVFDTFLSGLKDQRAQTGFTIGKLLNSLDKYDKKTKMVGCSSDGDCYRGYYSDFALEPGKTTVGDLRNYLKKKVIGKTFYGYKGGDYLMDEDTPIHVASYSDVGRQIVGVYEKDG